ncbi:beta-glucosidase BglX [Ferrimonas pelagia]|uniref:beta-glucosidase n=1 Tax=Ferrimonas pelagia TaxID=1177826 RepID=A0ABP9ECH9_9GAMM
MKRYTLSFLVSCAMALPLAMASDAGQILNPIKAASPASELHWQDDKAQMDAFVDVLIGRMTLAEKIGQLDLQVGQFAADGVAISNHHQERIREGKIGAVSNHYGAKWSQTLQRIAVEESRLGIPLLIGYDVVHGFKTIFPQSIGEAASWDLAMIEAAAAVAAREAAAEGVNWTFAPMADITRDPRWGRVSEGAGEDVYLVSKISAARVKGFQGADLASNDTLMATAKHFAGYGLAQAGRDYHSVDVSERELWSTQLPPFKAMLDAGVGAFMTAFHDLNGVPATGSQRLLTDILRQQWGFEGLVISDYTAINELVPHGYARDEAHATELALNAGVDMDMVGQLYSRHLATLVEQGRVSEAKIDASVRRVLEMKWRLGLFEDPYRYSDPQRAETEVLSEYNLALAREAARKSFVLLKNDNQTLPLQADKLGAIALIGPLADSKRDMVGNWAGAGDRRHRPVTLKEGLEARFGDELTIHYARGASNKHDVPPSNRQGFQAAIEAAKRSDLIVLAMGEHDRQTGEASSRVSLSLPGNQLALMEELKQLGKPMVLVVMSGRPNDLQWADQHVDAILHAWYPGTMGGHALADVLSGDHVPSGKLPMTFPRSVGQVPIYYNMKNTGRPYDATNPKQRQEHYKSRYDDAPNTPLYAFGHGLSYTRFDYGELQLSSDTLSMDGALTAQIRVTNSGDYAAEEVVQLYTRQRVGSATRPVKELKGFQKLHFGPGESKVVSFTLTAADLAFYRADMQWGAEPGRFELFIGTASDQLRSARFTLVD